MTEALQSTSRIDASVIVCTYNRSASLKRTLQSLQAQAVGDGVDWEVLIVDNNSKDDTRSVVEDFGATFSRVRYCYEPTQGLSFARNHGIAQARGNILLFTDDDVTPEPDWLRRILDGMARSGCDACGGYIAPLWESPPPAWLTDRFHGFLAIKAERTDTYEIVDGLPLPFGANMAFRREVFARFGVFDVTRGRRGDILASGEDGELFDADPRRGRQGHVFRQCAGASCGRRVSPDEAILPSLALSDKSQPGAEPRFPGESPSPWRSSVSVSATTTRHRARVRCPVFGPCGRSFL